MCIDEVTFILTYIQPPEKGFEVFHTLVDHSKRQSEMGYSPQSNDTKRQ